MSFLKKVFGFSLRERVRSSVIHEGLESVVVVQESGKDAADFILGTEPKIYLGTRSQDIRNQGLWL